MRQCAGVVGLFRRSGMDTEVRTMRKRDREARIVSLTLEIRRLAAERRKLLAEAAKKGAKS